LGRDEQSGVAGIRKFRSCRNSRPTASQKRTIGTSCAPRMVATAHPLIAPPAGDRWRKVPAQSPSGLKSLPKRLVRWESIVLLLSPSLLAISLLECPAVIRRRVSVSRRARVARVTPVSAIASHRSVMPRERKRWSRRIVSFCPTGCRQRGECGWMLCPDKRFFLEGEDYI
jgi:hypothetical protein